MSPVSGLARDAAASMARHVSSVVAGFVTLFVLARVLGAARLGFWSLLGTSAFLLGLCDLGLNAATLRASAGTNPGIAKQIAKTAAFVTSVLAVPAAFVSFLWLSAAADHLPISQQADARTAVVVALVAGAINAAAQSSRSYAQGQGRIVSLAWARALAVSLQLVITLALLYFGLGLRAVAIGYAGAVALEAVLGFRAASDKISWSGLPPAHERKEIIHVAGAAMLTNVSVIFMVRADLIILERITDLATIGAYSVAARLVDQGFTLVKQVSSALVPRLGKRSADRAASVEFGTAIVGVLASGPLAAVAVAGKPFVLLWAGPAVDLPILGVALAWLALAAMLSSIQEVCASAMSLSGDAVAVARIISLGSAINVAASLLGGFYYGPWAVAAATFLGNSIMAVLMWRLTSRTLDFGIPRIARTLAAPLLAAMVGASVAFVAIRIGLHGLVAASLGIVLSLAVASLPLLKTRRILAQEA